MPRIYDSPISSRLLQHIKENPGLTAKDLSDELGLAYRQVTESTRRLREHKLIYRSGWVSNTGTGGLHSPQYTAGEGVEPRRPKADRKAHCQRYYEKHKSRIRALGQYRRTGTVNPFLQLIKIK